MPSSHLILCYPLLLLPPNLASIRVFSNESTLRMRWPKYWSFSFSISPSKEIPGLISFRMTGWVVVVVVKVTQSCPTLATPWTVARQIPLSMGFPRQEYWSGLPFPSPGDLPNPGIKPMSPALQADSSSAELGGKPFPLRCHIPYPDFAFHSFSKIYPVQKVIVIKEYILDWGSR